MKKLKLTALQLGAESVLSRSQLKNVLGGSAAATSGCLANEYYGCDSVACCAGCTCKSVNGDHQCQGSCKH